MAYVFLGLNAILLEKENELAKVRDELTSLEPYKVSFIFQISEPFSWLRSLK